jgi:aryl-alcohol dehydrogenase-like predicted oxidoreductase
MDYRQLGRTDLKVSAICLGTMTWGQQNTEAEGHEQMDYALAQGINVFDTAELYSIPPMRETQGSTERIIGTWFKARNNRDKVVLATKAVGRSDAMTWFREGDKPARVTKAQLVEACDKSLARLQTDYIDLYQLHFPERPIQWGSNPTRFNPSAYAPAADENPIEAQLEAFDALVKAGKVRHIGLSNESAWGTMRFVTTAEHRGLPRVQSIQNAYSLLNRTFEVALAEVQLREQVGLLAYSPLAQGYLTGKYLYGAKPPGARSTLFNRGQRYETPGSEAAISDYIALAREYGVDPAALALAFVTSRPFVTSNIIGATSMAQLKVAVEGSLAVTITPELEQRIDAIHQLRGNPCP